IGLTTKVEVRREQIADLRRMRDLAAREIIHCLDAGKQLTNRVKLVEVCRERLRAVTLDIFRQHGQIEIRGVRLVERLHVALLPVANEIAVQRAGPTHAPFKEGKLECGETASDAIQEQ